MSHYAVVFPGQGSQSIGMLSSIINTNDLVLDYISRASKLLNLDLLSMIVSGPSELLNSTENTQPILLTLGYAIWQVLSQDLQLAPKFMAGHSLGEYTALAAAGSIDFDAAVKLMHLRGRLMSEVMPKGKMAAIIGLQANEISNLCETVSTDEDFVSAANFNSKQQVVVSGHPGAVNRLIQKAKEMGAKRALPLKVSVASHCNLMKPMVPEYQQALSSIEFQLPKFTIINNVDVLPLSDEQQIKESLVRQLYASVRWVETIEYMARQGVDLIIEVGPGKVLSGLIKRINTDITVISINQLDDFLTLKERLTKNGVS